MTEISDKYLLTRLSEGRKDAYEELFARYYTKVRKFIGSVLFGSVDADDLAQNVFLKVWERRRDLAAVDSWTPISSLWQGTKSAIVSGSIR